MQNLRTHVLFIFTISLTHLHYSSAQNSTECYPTATQITLQNKLDNGLLVDCKATSGRLHNEGLSARNLQGKITLPKSVNIYYQMKSMEIDFAQRKLFIPHHVYLRKDNVKGKAHNVSYVHDEHIAHLNQPIICAHGTSRIAGERGIIQYKTPRIYLYLKQCDMCFL